MYMSHRFFYFSPEILMVSTTVGKVSISWVLKWPENFVLFFKIINYFLYNFVFLKDLVHRESASAAGNKKKLLIRCKGLLD